jgi:hypothetical protein
VLGEIITHDTFDQEEGDDMENYQKKSVAFKASTSKCKKKVGESNDDEDSSSSTINDEKMAL